MRRHVARRHHPRGARTVTDPDQILFAVVLQFIADDASSLASVLLLCRRSASAQPRRSRSGPVTAALERVERHLEGLAQAGHDPESSPGKRTRHSHGKTAIPEPSPGLAAVSRAMAEEEPRISPPGKKRIESAS